MVALNSTKRAPAGGIVASDDGGKDQVEEADEEVGEAEQHRFGAEGARHGQGDPEHGRHRGEHGQSDGTLVDVHRAGQPRVDVPGPPQGGEHEHAPQDSAPRGVGGQEPRDLGDGEDEDQIEEQLERGDLVLGVPVVLVLCPGHGRG